MVMSRGIGYRKCNLHDWIQALQALHIKVSLRLKSEPVIAGFENSIGRKQPLHASVGICLLRG